MKVPAFYSLVLENSGSILQAWIPFLAPGGLWVRTRREHVLGEKVVLLVQLPGGAKRSVAGRVAWIGAENRSRSIRRKTGIVLDGAEGAELAARIRQLAGTEPAPAEALLACS